MEDKLLRRSSAGKCGDLVLQLLLAHQIMVAVLHLHRVSEGAGSTRHDRNLLHRSGIVLFRCHKRMADLMVGNNFFLLIGKDGILLLISRDNDFYTLLKIRLFDITAVFPYRTERCLIDNIGKLCT